MLLILLISFLFSEQGLLIRLLQTEPLCAAEPRLFQPGTYNPSLLKQSTMTRSGQHSGSARRTLGGGSVSSAAPGRQGISL